MRWWDNITDSMDVSLSKHQEIVKNRATWWLEAMESQRAEHNVVTEHQQQQQNSSILSLLKKLHTIFHSGHTNVYVHQQRSRQI